MADGLAVDCLSKMLVFILPGSPNFGCNDTPEINGTLADFTLTSGKQIITRVLDKRARTTRDLIRVPLYPLAEWLVTNFLRRSHG